MSEESPLRAACARICGFGMDSGAVEAMFAAARGVGDPDRLRAVRSDLPLYIAVGEDDPVNAQLALVHPLVEAYGAAGLSSVTLRSYPGARHEILNETNRDEVVADLICLARQSRPGVSDQRH